jgi:hypothetical protein
MKHRDILVDEAEQIGKAFGAFLAKMIDAESSLPINQDVISHLEKSLGINILDFIKLDQELLFEKLKSTLLNDDAVETLSDIFFEVVKKSYSSKQIDENIPRFMKKAILILEYLQKHSKNYSLNWDAKLTTMRKLKLE